MEDEISSLVNKHSEVELESADSHLKELCEAVFLTVPIYDYEQIAECPEPMFEATCHLKEHLTTGIGTNKKLAKKSASKEMITYLIETDPSFKAKYINRKRKQKFSHLIPELQVFRKTNVDATKCLTNLCSRTGSFLKKDLISVPHYKCTITTDWGTVVGDGSTESKSRDSASAKMLNLIQQTMFPVKSEKTDTFNEDTEESE